MNEGVFAVPCRLLLSAIDRERLERLCRGREQDIHEVVSAVVAEYLDHLPDEQLAAPLPASPLESQPHHEHQRRELRRLLMRQQQLGPAAPAWIAEYIAELEADVAQQRLPDEEQR